MFFCHLWVGGTGSHPFFEFAHYRLQAGPSAGRVSCLPRTVVNIAPCSWQNHAKQMLLDPQGLLKIDLCSCVSFRWIPCRFVTGLHVRYCWAASPFRSDFLCWHISLCASSQLVVGGQAQSAREEAVMVKTIVRHLSTFCHTLDQFPEIRPSCKSERRTVWHWQPTNAPPPRHGSIVKLGNWRKIKCCPCVQLFYRCAHAALSLVGAIFNRKKKK